MEKQMELPSPPPRILFRPGDAVLIPTLRDIFTADPDQFIAKYTDIAAVNLACAEGLASEQPIDIPKYLELLDRMADAVRARVEKSWRLFKLKPGEYNNSENVFRVMTMEHVVRIGFGVQYDPLVAECTETGKKRKLDSSETFIHGILSEKRAGTCSSLPVFAVAVGRRCGYPLYFVRAPNHGLYRWHDEGEKFNYQHSPTGGGIFPDEYYHTWPRKWDEVDYKINARTKVWLHSLTARQEVSKFLCNRAICLREEQRYQEALLAVDVAERFDPINPACGDIGYDICVKMGGTRIGNRASAIPAGFPSGNFAVGPTQADAQWLERTLVGPVVLWQFPRPARLIPVPPLFRLVPHHGQGVPLPEVHHPKAPRVPTPFDHLRNQFRLMPNTPISQPPITPNSQLLPKLVPARMAPRVIRAMPQFPETIPQPSQQDKERPK